MGKYLEYLLEVLSKFAGGRGDLMGDTVLHGLAGAMWLGLLAMAWAKRRGYESPREKLLMWGFGLALLREVFMFSAISLRGLGIVRAEAVHAVFPPIEHVLFDAAAVVIAGAFLRYITEDPRLSRRYLAVALAGVCAAYLATFWWWARYIAANPLSRFGQTWCDWLFRINASACLAVAMAALAVKGRGRPCRAVLAALGLMLLYEFLKLPDMALGEAYKGVFTPIRHSFYLWSVVLLGFVYIREQFDERRAMAGEVLAASDRERGRVSRDLHDALGQQLTGLACMSKALANRLAAQSPAESAKAGEIAEAANEAMRRARRLAKGLRPVELPPEDLEAALREMVADARDMFGVACTFRCDGPVDLRDERVAEHMFRIVQEALTNTVRHARADRIDVELTGRPGRVVVRVVDNGRGLPPQQGRGNGMGLRIMRYRAEVLGGTLAIRSNPTGGTIVACEIPTGQVIEDQEAQP